MAFWESLALWAAIITYCAAAAVYGGALVFSSDRLWRIGKWAILPGFGFHALTIALRWWGSGHVPTIGNYETALLLSFFVTVFTVGFSFRYPAFAVTGLFSIPVVVMTLGFGLMSRQEAGPLVASLQSWWLYIHIFFAWLVVGSTTFAFACALLYILKERRERRGTLTAFWNRIPSLEDIDVLVYRNVIYGFLSIAAMIASGALWARNLWGAYWSWDPVETWSLICWLLYGLILHIRFTFGWSGRRMAWLVVLALPSVFLVMFGINLAVETSKHIINVQ